MIPSRTTRRRFLAGLLALPLASGLAACGDDDDGAATPRRPTRRCRDDRSRRRSRSPCDLGYFPNITHAPALVGVQRGPLRGEPPGQRHARDRSRSTPVPRRSRPCSPTASTSRYIGPNPAINAYAQSGRRGRADHRRLHLRRRLPRRARGHRHRRAARRHHARHPAARQHPGRRPAQLPRRRGLRDRHRRRRRRLASRPQANGDALAAFLAGEIDGAWVPEPFATRYIHEGGAHVLVDEPTCGRRPAASS